MSGRGRVLAYTINPQVLKPVLAEPCVVAIIEREEQDRHRCLSNVVNCPPEDVEFGMPVTVVFEQLEDVWIPMFERAAA